MITITSNEEARALVHNGVLAIDDDLEIAFDGFYIDADIKCKNIYSKSHPRDINVLDINAWNLDVGDINADDIKASCDIRAYGYIHAAGDIIAADIKAKGDIKANNINVHGNINADDITYHGICCAYRDIYCISIHGSRENARHFCLDGKITIREK